MLNIAHTLFLSCRRFLPYNKSKSRDNKLDHYSLIYYEMLVDQSQVIVEDFLNTSHVFPSCVTIGNFDGVHIGHQQLIQNLLQVSKKNNSSSVALTFSPHPIEFFSKQNIELLVPLFTRVSMLKHAGLETVKVIHFSELFSKLGYQEFCDYLIKNYQLKALVVGSNTHIGKDREGSPEKIKEYLMAKGIETQILNIQEAQGDGVSSSRIRKLISSGQITQANQLLGYSYFIRGEVVEGKGKGKGIGFPTANLKHEERLCLPACGVYKTKVSVKGKSYLALTNIGFAPTIKNSDSISIETHIPKYTGSALYGECMQVDFIEKIRDEQKFESVKDLQLQIKKDLQML